MNVKRIALTAGLGAGIMLALVAATCGDTTTRIESPGSASQTGIMVSGTGKVSAKPDIARVTLGVSTLRDTVQAARDQAAASMDAIITSMKADGVADKDIQTQQLNIQPEYDYSNSKQTLRGFRVTNTVTATVRNINATSKLVDDAVAAGGDDTQIQNIAFSIDKPDDLKQQARKQAVEDAKQKAQTLADAAGVAVGGAITISETGYTPPVYYDRAASGPVAAPQTGSTPIQPGELDVQIDVSVTWSIK